LVCQCSIELPLRIMINLNTGKWNFDIHCIYVVSYARHIQLPYIYMEYT
jgi:hypothetical protein